MSSASEKVLEGIPHIVDFFCHVPQETHGAHKFQDRLIVIDLGGIVFLELLQENGKEDLLMQGPRLVLGEFQIHILQVAQHHNEEFERWVHCKLSEEDG